MLRHSLSGLKTPATAAVIQTAPPVTHRQTAVTLPAPLQMTATAAVTATALLHPPLPPPLHPLTAQTQEAAVIQIRDLQRRRRRRNKRIHWKSRIFPLLFVSQSNFSYRHFFSFCSDLIGHLQGCESDSCTLLIRFSKNADQKEDSIRFCFQNLSPLFLLLM